MTDNTIMDRCTHGGDCTVHPGEGRLHNYDADELRAELATAREQRDLNSDLLDGTAKALGMDLTDPDVHYAFEIPTKVAKVVAALAKSRKQADAYANEIGSLMADLARMRAENAARDTVVDAAKVWRAQFEKPIDRMFPRQGALIAAVDALPKAAAV
ncbi:hypothetical protein AB0J14_04470 [Micromonospora arborensis]|uniref:hypothetical protein n=1 Tax=Micromonospora arborensis TaxID=2116518 RepID=UPI0033F824F5